MTQHRPTTGLHRLSTPRAAGLAGVLFAVLFGAAIALIRSALPEGAAPGSQWLDAGSTRLRLASLLIPFAGIAFLWFIGVVRDGFGRYEDKFFASVFLGSGILFLAMTFVAAGLAAGLVASAPLLDKSGDASGASPLAQVVIIALFKTYAIRMAAVFMISLATIWLKTGLMPKWLVGDHLSGGGLAADRQRHQHVDRAGVPGLGAGCQPAGAGQRRGDRSAPRR